MKVTDLNEYEVIHCSTFEEAKAICKLMHEAGLRWSDGDSYKRSNEWEVFEEKTCYRPNVGFFESIEYCKKEGYKIYPASDFLKH